MDILRDLQKGIMDVDSIRDKNRKGPEDNHLVSLVEGSGAFSWMLQPGKPDEYIGEVLGGARMYSNRILTEYKDKYGNLHIETVVNKTDLGRTGTKLKWSG